LSYDFRTILHFADVVFWKLTQNDYFLLVMCVVLFAILQQQYQVSPSGVQMLSVQEQVQSNLVEA
jgi:hypothetical protein